MRLFPKNYEDALIKFRQATSALKAESGVWSVGTGLDIDHRYWPALKEKKTLFVLVSGVHGPETYAGHAIQMMFLKELWPKLKRENCGVLLVHSLNPYGFKNHRRCTEAGVNLNRNCSIFDELYKIDNHASVAMGRKFVPREPVKSTNCFLFQSLRRSGGQVSFGDVGLDEFVRTVLPGQFETPEGLEFGGKGPEPQIRSLIGRLKEVLPGYRDIVFLDLHTGLGHRGRLHLLTGDKKGCVNPSLMKDILDPAADHDSYEYTPNDSQGFYPTFGSTNDLLSEMVGEKQRLCALTMEFGTLGHDLDSQLESINVWLSDHQGGFFGYANPDLEQVVKTRHLEKFYPSDKTWEESVINASRLLFTRILKRAGHL